MEEAEAPLILRFIMLKSVVVFLVKVIEGFMNATECNNTIIIAEMLQMSSSSELIKYHTHSTSLTSSITLPFSSVLQLLGMDGWKCFRVRKRKLLSHIVSPMMNSEHTRKGSKKC